MTTMIPPPLVGYLVKKLGKKLALDPELDPELLGGARVVIGNTVIDGSVRRYLDDLGEKLRALKVG